MFKRSWSFLKISSVIIVIIAVFYGSYKILLSDSLELYVTIQSGKVDLKPILEGEIEKLSNAFTQEKTDKTLIGYYKKIKRPLLPDKYLQIIIKNEGSKIAKKVSCILPSIAPIVIITEDNKREVKEKAWKIDLGDISQNQEVEVLAWYKLSRPVAENVKVLCENGSAKKMIFTPEGPLLRWLHKHWLFVIFTVVLFPIVMILIIIEERPKVKKLSN